ncbi:MAG: ABC transporter permease subunit [Dehalococcoidales bacterium]|nr:ABC transporter permease subunit [Dehalococcoidales bacterium]
MQGMMEVFRKELADDFTRWRFLILFAIAFAVAIFAIYMDAQYIKLTVSDTRFVFLKLYTTSGDESLPLFIMFFVFFLPVIGIALGFDAINSEKNSGTLSRLMSQSIYRDAVVNGKFLAGMVTIAVMLSSVVLVVGGVGLRLIGIPPSAEEALRLIFFVIVGVVYGSFWLGLSILFSIFFTRVATSALASIAMWIFFIFLFAIPLFANLGGTAGYIVMQVSPISLFWESATVLLVPSARTMAQMLNVTMNTNDPFLPTSALSVGQSLLTVWPHIVSLIALTAICFAISYIKFMREEIRST